MDIELGNPAHVGHVVADLDQAMAQYAAELDVRWAEPVSYGKAPHTSRFTCSVEGPVPVELIEQVPGTIWTVERHTPLHHLAYWTDDMRGMADQLASRGMRLEASGPTFAYLRSDVGMRIELMDRSLEAAWNGWLRGGQLFRPARPGR